jgi:large subunit ribosomal protein L22
MSDMQTVRASAKGIRQTPRKVSLVAALIRGRSVADALAILQHTPKRAAKPLAKVIAAAKANAINNHRLKEDGLMISQLQVTSGPRLKRFNPAAMGRALPYLKRASHVLVEVTGEVKPKKPAVEAKAAPKTKKEAK